MNSTSNKQLEANNLKVIKDQLGYEALMNKKYNEYSNAVTDASLKTLCTDASQMHKNNFNTLKSYLETHE